MHFIPDMIKMETVETKRVESKLKRTQKEAMIDYNDKLEVKEFHLKNVKGEV